MNAEAGKILTELKKKQYHPVYFLQGEEPFFIDQISSFIEQNVLSDAEKGFNQVVLYGKDILVNSLLTHARRYPMMAERQVIIIKEAQDIPDLVKENGMRLLLDYLEKPVPTTLLVFCHKNKTLDKRKELGKRIAELTVCLTTKKLYDNQLPAFALEYSRNQGISIDEKGIIVLCELVGNDLSRLTNEMDKMGINQKAGEVISADEVLNQVGISREFNVFELQKAILERDVLLANRIVDFFENSLKRNPIIPVVAFLYSFFSKTLMASAVQDRSGNGIAKALNISPYSARNYSLALHVFPVDKLIENISFIKEADLKLKGVDAGSISESQVFRELVFRLMHKVN